MHNKIDYKLKELTETVKRLVFDIPKFELADKLEITRFTLNRRLKEHTWTYKEYLIISELSNKTH